MRIVTDVIHLFKWGKYPEYGNTLIVRRYADTCSSYLQLLPLYMMDLLGDFHGLPGLLLSCVFSGSLRYVALTLTRYRVKLIRFDRQREGERERELCPQTLQHEHTA